jgi:hypothetical protein
MLTAEQADWAERVPPGGQSVALVKPVTMRQLKDEVQRLAPISLHS